MEKEHLIRKWCQGQKRVARAEQERAYDQEKVEKAVRRAARKAEKQIAAGKSGDRAGIVAEVRKARCLVLHEGSYLDCPLEPRILRALPEVPVVGDRVSFDLDESGRGTIRQILPRSTKLVRMRTQRRDSTRQSLQEEHVLAANVDVAVIVASVALPPFHPRLVDRYLIMCRYGDVSPVLCINKCDLVEDPPDLSIYQRLGIPVIYTSADTGQGIGELREQIQGKYSVLTGHSGVGKSSLINRLLEEEILQVADVSSASGRGRHTTTVSSLHKLDDTTYLIDTPGIRSLSLWEVDRQSLRFYFPEFEEPSLDCKFRNCLHDSEPDCGVKEAVERGEIPEERYDSYLRVLSAEC
ncbi:MAG: ribosome small subunit-dependent GTPase A [Chloroflexota bacterium]|jgi:ribosome biogenesis GTPase